MGMNRTAVSFGTSRKGGAKKHSTKTSLRNSRHSKEGKRLGSKKVTLKVKKEKVHSKKKRDGNKMTMLIDEEIGADMLPLSKETEIRDYLSSLDKTNREDESQGCFNVDADYTISDDDGDCSADATLIPEDELAEIQRLESEAEEIGRRFVEQLCQKYWQSQGQSSQVRSVPEAVSKHYKNVGNYLSTYRTGKLPGAIKALPRVGNWNLLLFLTTPETWTPQATYAITKLYLAALNRRNVQVYIENFLYPIVRKNFNKHKKLQYHVFHATRKALFRPACWLRAFVLKLSQEGCSVREATLISSIVFKASVPVVYAAAAVMRLCDISYNNAVGIFLLALLKKHYSLPNATIARLAAFFEGFASIEGPLPVLWHRCVLCCVEKYRGGMTQEQIEGFKKVIKVHHHDAITPWISEMIVQQEASIASQMMVD